MLVRVLGPVGVFVDGVEISIPAGKPRALLAMLALAGGRSIGVETLVSGLWGDDAPMRAVKTMQVHLSTLRSRLRVAGVEVMLTSAGYCIDVDSDDIDVGCFERLAERGLSALADHRPDVASQALRGALELWTGAALSNVLDSPFAAHESDRLALRRLGVIQGKVDADLALGLGATLVDEVREVAVANPYNERACGQLMVALYRAGQPAAALDAYRHFRRTLGEELGLEPGPDLVELERQILVHDDQLLVQPVGATARRHHLPQPLSSFVGRAREVDELRDVLRSARLATLTGAGGTGKTRLALAVAELCADEFEGGVWAVELGPLASSEHVLAAAAQTLGVRHHDGVQGMAEELGDRSLLVVLDNCEHVIDAAAELAEALLQRCPALHILATSREPLAIDGEHIYRVPPLGLPHSDVSDAVEASASEAVLLFVERARLHRHDFTLNDANALDVARICARLDGMPLAIELAAARIRTLSIDELSRRLDQRFQLLTTSTRGAPPRQHTLRALIDWSYDLLSDVEQRLLERLSVFVGGFTMDAAEAICSIEPGIDVLELVTALVDKSLVEVDGKESRRLRMLETIRDYAAERFAARPASMIDAARLDHARHFLAMAEEAARSLEHGFGQQEWLPRLTIEHENLRAAADTFILLPDCREDGLRLANSLRSYWDYRGLFAEGAAITAGFLELSDTSPVTETYVHALCTASEMFACHGDLGPAEQYAERAANLADVAQRALQLKAAIRRAVVTADRGDYQAALDVLAPHLTTNPDHPDYVKLHGVRAFSLMHLGDLSGSKTALMLSVDAARASGDARGLANNLSNLSCVDLAEGDLAAATTHLREAHTLAARSRNYPTLAAINDNLGQVAVLGECYEEAWVRYREALLLAWPGGELGPIRGAILGIALCCGAEGNHLAAARLHGFLVAVDETSDAAFDPTDSLLRRNDWERLRNELGEVDFEHAVQQGRTMTLAEAVVLAKEAATMR